MKARVLPRTALILATTLALARLSNAAGPISFDIPNTTSILGGNIRLVDLDGGLPDLLSRDGANVVLRSNQGGLQFGPNQLIPLAPSGSLIRYEALDLDGDGDRDLIGLTTTPQLVTRINLGGLAFGAATPHALPSIANGMVAADLDADGDLDLATCHIAAGVVSVFANQGNGTFAAPVSYVYATPPAYSYGTTGFLDIVAGRFDADADLDLAMLDHYPRQTLTVLFNQGDGTFAGSVQTPTLPTFQGRLLTADLDENGLDDLVVGIEGPVIQILTATGGGAFASTDTLPMPGGGNSTRALLADLNQDGHLDVVNAYSAGSWINLDRNYLGVWLGDGTGRFENAYDVQIGSDPSDAAVAELDGDGKLDAIVVTRCASIQGGCVSGAPPVAWILPGREAGALGGYRTLFPSADCYSTSCPGGPGVAWAQARAGAPDDLLLEENGSVSWRRNRGQGVLDPPLPLSLAKLGRFIHLDGDGREDLVLASHDSVGVQRSIGDVAWGSPTWYPGGVLVAFADFDGDGKIDLATRDGARRLNLRNGDGAGTFGPSVITDLLLRGDYSADFGDTDGDGRADVVISIEDPGVTGRDSLFVIGLPPGGGTDTLAWFEVPCKSTGFPLGFCRKGRPVIASAGAGLLPNLYVLMGSAGCDCSGFVLSYHRQPDGSYAEVTRWETPRDPLAVSATDFDLDGVDDLLFFNGNDCCIGSATIFQGSPSGAITPAFGRYIGPYPGAGTADIDGDGRPDLATYLGFYDRIGFLLNTTLVDEPTPTLLALVSAESAPDIVRLDWFGAAEAPLARVERRTAASAWVTLGEIAATGGHFIYEDRAVRPGERYAYRLASASGEPLTEEAWIEVPRALPTILESVRPNPVNGSGQVSFSLGTGGPVRLDVLDVAGRRVAAESWPHLAAGAHAKALPGAAQLKPGLYLLRLVTADGVRAKRFVTSR